jgi:electron-transferring-flavoprotein dehydrogenase
MTTPIDRQSMDVDIVCVGLRPGHGRVPDHALAGPGERGRHAGVESRVMPGMPPQVICYERADDIGFGVSGVVTPGAASRRASPTSTRPDPDGRPGARRRWSTCSTRSARAGAPRRCAGRRLSALLAMAAARARPRLRAAVHPAVPAQARRLVLSIGQFNQWVGSSHGHAGWCRSGRACRSSGAAHRGRNASACAWSTRAWTSRAAPTRASCRAWTSAPR